MTTEQKLREAFEARMTDNGKWPRAVEQGRNGCYLLAQTENAWAEWQACAEALATTGPEPTGMPEMPEPYRLLDKHLSHPVFRQVLFAPGEYFTSDQMRTYGEQCWKAGCKHGAWSDKPASNQQLTTEPVDEREAFESEMRSRHGWNNSYFTQSNDGGYLSNRATHAYIGWQARAAMAQVGAINVVESFTNDAKDAERYRWLADGNNYYEAINLISDGSLTEDALGKAIDAAMAQGVKG